MEWGGEPRQFVLKKMKRKRENQEGRSFKKTAGIIDYSIINR